MADQRDNLAAVLRMERARKRHSQGEAAEEMGVSRNLVQRWETDLNTSEEVLTVGNLRRIALYCERAEEVILGLVPTTVQLQRREDRETA